MVRGGVFAESAVILEESTLGVPLTVSPCSAVILEESTPSTLIRRQAQVNMKLQYFCTKTIILLLQLDMLFTVQPTVLHT